MIHGADKISYSQSLIDFKWNKKQESQKTSQLQRLMPIMLMSKVVCFFFVSERLL